MRPAIPAAMAKQVRHTRRNFPVLVFMVNDEAKLDPCRYMYGDKGYEDQCDFTDVCQFPGMD